MYLKGVVGGRKRTVNGKEKLQKVVLEFVRKVLKFGHVFVENEQLVSLVKYYVLQFLHRHIPSAGVTEEEMGRFESTVISSKPSSLMEFLSNTKLVKPDMTHRSATILSPQTNTDRVLKFPFHLSHVIDVEAETVQCDPAHLAVKVTYPGGTEEVCQPVTECHLKDYYQSQIFLSGPAWSVPGCVRVTVVSECQLGESDAVFKRLLGEEKVWVEVSDSVELKIHPSVPR
eukprot:sb/3469475/